MRNHKESCSVCWDKETLLALVFTLFNRASDGTGI